MPARCNPRRLKKYSAVDAPARAHCFAVRAYGRRGGTARARGGRGRRRGSPQRPGGHDRPAAAPRRAARAAPLPARAREAGEDSADGQEPAEPAGGHPEAHRPAQAAVDRPRRRDAGPLHARSSSCSTSHRAPARRPRPTTPTTPGRCACPSPGRPASSTDGFRTSGARSRRPRPSSRGCSPARSRAAAPTSASIEPRGFEAAAAADEQGTVRRVSVGPATTVAFRAQQLLQRHRFIVVSPAAEEHSAASRWTSCCAIGAPTS